MAAIGLCAALQVTPTSDAMETTKKESAVRQINAAIRHFECGEIDCAITLAAAAEGLLGASDNPHIFRDLRASPDAADIDLNLVINWLKHPIEPDAVRISEFEGSLVIARAITKFIAVHHQSTARFKKFLQSASKAGHLPFENSN
jgi:hypothetical protein